MEPPRSQPVLMTCDKCKHEWRDFILVNVSCERAAKHMFAMECPVCRSKDILMKPE